MSPQGFFGDPTSALLPATALSGTNGNWFFGRNKYYKFGLSEAEKERIDMEYSKQRRQLSRLRQQRIAAQIAMKKRRRMRPPGGPLYGFGTISDSLSGMVKPYVPNMRKFPMLGAYPGEVGPGILPGGTAGNGAFVGPENPLLSYYFTYGRRRSARKGVRRSIRKGQKSKAKQLIHDTISKPITDYKGMYKPISKPISSMTRDGLIKNLRKFRDSWEKITGKYQDLSDERLNAESTDQLRKHIKFYYSESAKKLAENWLRNYV